LNLHTHRSPRCGTRRFSGSQTERTGAMRSLRLRHGGRSDKLVGVRERECWVRHVGLSSVRAAIFVGSVLLLGCSSGSPSEPSCVNIGGTWMTGGTCGSLTCLVSQSACSTNLSCNNGSESFSGSLSGSSFTYTGTQSSGAAMSCQGTVSGSNATGTCTVGNATCSLTATKQ
jgi:hypothetical protein